MRQKQKKTKQNKNRKANKLYQCVWGFMDYMSKFSRTFNFCSIT